MSVLPDLLKTRQAHLALRNLLLKPIRLPRPAAQHRRCTAAWLAACGVRGFRGGRTALLYGADFAALPQRDEPLVHILYDKVNEVTRICFRMFLKTEVVAEKVGNELKATDCEKSENWLPSKKNMEIGSGTKRLVSGLPDDKQTVLYRLLWLE